MARRRHGDETWFRLREWTSGQKAAERLTAHILAIAGYQSIDPSHPLGGPDGLKDLVCTHDNRKWIGAAYFPSGQKDFPEIRGKFEHDLQGVSINQANGIAFVTNQQISLNERRELLTLAAGVEVDLFHLERISFILDEPGSYGIRLEFLDIEMTKEEQIAFNSANNQALNLLKATVEELVTELKAKEPEKSYTTPVYVTPYIYASATSASSILARSQPLFKCSFCGYGYIVSDDPRLSILSSLMPSAIKSVTCPQCGNTDKL